MGVKLHTEGWIESRYMSRLEDHSVHKSRNGDNGEWERKELSNVTSFEFPGLSARKIALNKCGGTPLDLTQQIRGKRNTPKTTNNNKNLTRNTVRYISLESVLLEWIISLFCETWIRKEMNYKMEENPKDNELW